MLSFFIIVLGVVMVAIIGAYILLPTITVKEVIVQTTIAVIIAGTSALIASCQNTADTESWNGRVIDKQQERVSCSHSYSCNCRTSCTGGKNNSCTTTCDTCYDHPYDYDWNVYTSNNETITIDREDRQGTTQPSRWTAVNLGDPTSIPHSYVNYVKAAPDTLFRRQGNEGKYVLPDYPGRFYDYYRLDRYVSDGILVDSRAWNTALSELNAELGRSKQVNVVVVLTRDKPRDWFYALEQFWIGGKKNDVVLVVSVDKDMKPQWAETMAWVTDQTFKVRLKSVIMQQEKVTLEETLSNVKAAVSLYYKRKPMSDYEYLSSSMTPSVLQWVITLIVNLMAAAATIYVAHKHEFSSNYRMRLLEQRKYNEWRHNWR